jgi:hypothetical protein
VHRTRRAHRFQRLRRHAASRIFALAFIALILVPFTAPFPTYQFDAAHGRPYDALPKEFKDKLGSDDGLVLPSECQVTVPALTAHFILPTLRSDQISNQQLRHTVLRV